MSDYKIYPLDNQRDSAATTIIRPKTNTLIVAPVNSGKTSLLINLFIREAFGFKGRFSRIIIVSPNDLRLDPKWSILLKMKDILRGDSGSGHDGQLLDLTDNGRTSATKHKRRDPRRIHPDDVFIGFDADRIMGIVEESRERLLNDPSYEVAMIFDDMPALCMFEGRKNLRVTKELTSILRHLRVTCLYSSQSYLAAPRFLRLNVTGIVLFNCWNVGERARIYQENAICKSMQEFNALFDHMLTQPGWPFIYLCLTNPVHQKVVQNFDEIVYT